MIDPDLDDQAPIRGRRMDMAPATMSGHTAMGLSKPSIQLLSLSVFIQV
jgi:hypothetical protein